MTQVHAHRFMLEKSELTNKEVVKRTVPKASKIYRRSPLPGSMLRKSQPMDVYQSPRCGGLPTICVSHHALGQARHAYDMFDFAGSLGLVRQRASGTSSLRSNLFYLAYGSDKRQLRLCSG